MTNKERIEAIKGNYTFKSPYHKNKRLPFTVVGESIYPEFPVDVRTVAYRGWEKENVFTQYTIESIEEKIQSKFLKRV
jgi:hypothetical protein